MPLPVLLAVAGGALLGRELLTGPARRARQSATASAVLSELAALQEAAGAGQLVMPESLPAAIEGYVQAGRIEEARNALDDFSGIMVSNRTRQLSEQHHRDDIDARDRTARNAEEKLAFEKQKWAAENDPTQVAKLAMASQGYTMVPDPQQGNAMVAQPLPGPKNTEIREKAVNTMGTVAMLAELSKSVAINGIIRDPASPEGARQRSMFRQLGFGISKAVGGGAFDQGLAEQVGGITGSPDDARQFFLGTDAAGMARLEATRALFEPGVMNAMESVRLLPGIAPRIRGALDEAAREYQRSGQLLELGIRRAQANGGNVIPPYLRAASPEQRQEAYRRGASAVFAGDPWGTLTAGGANVATQALDAARESYRNMPTGQELLDSALQSMVEEMAPRAVGNFYGR